MANKNLHINDLPVHIREKIMDNMDIIDAEDIQANVIRHELRINRLALAKYLFPLSAGLLLGSIVTLVYGPVWSAMLASCFVGLVGLMFAYEDKGTKVV